jgi:hypothetical protein
MDPRKTKLPALDGDKLTRRSLARRVLGAAAIAAAIPSDSLRAAAPSPAAATGGVVNFNSRQRATASFQYRSTVSHNEAIDAGVQAGNGDSLRFTDFSGNFTKSLTHDGLGVPNRASVNSLIQALQSGSHSDFEKILVGTPGGGGNSKLNGPQGALAFDLEGLDSHAVVIPAAPGVASAQTAAEAVEHYWGALLRDVPFRDYPTNPVVAQAVSDLNNLSFVKSAANNQFPYPVTPQNLFRGQCVPGDGNVKGPYISQFLVQPTFFGAQPLAQQFQTFLPAGLGGSDYMTSVNEYQLIQNGGDSGRTLAIDPSFRYLHTGRGMASYTHVDVLYQAYFTAFCVLNEIGTPLNPGNPYRHSKTQRPFGTLGGPDAAGTLTEMATRALKAAWFHKWIKDLRLRPEEYGALVHANLAKTNPVPQAAMALHADVLNSAALPLIHSAYGSYLLPQAFPEGSPVHPCYPTGHGSVAGACITALKFFFDCSQKLRPLLNAAGRDVMEPSSDGLSLNAYTGADSDQLDIAGELLKLAYNISIGHGIHAGIHFRSSSYWSILLGEQVALSILQDRAGSYNEPFAIEITKMDGTAASIGNMN